MRIRSKRWAVSDTSPAPLISCQHYWTYFISYAEAPSLHHLHSVFLSPIWNMFQFLQPFRFKAQQQDCSNNFPPSFQFNSSHFIRTPNSDLFQHFSCILRPGRQKSQWFKHCGNSGSWYNNLSFRTFGYYKIKNKKLWLMLFTRQNRNRP